jgi:acetyltransferase-like isoleucine patch superfamily enzyme
MTIHVVRVFAGPAFRSTTFWSWYMRLNGARLGRLVWVNSLSLMDHNLLEFGDGVVIGSDAHVSGHIVERGMLKTARVRLGAGTVIGVGTVVGIGVESGAGTQVGPLSVVPKFTQLDAGASYLGVPVHRLH